MVVVVGPDLELLELDVDLAQQVSVVVEQRLVFVLPLRGVGVDVPLQRRALAGRDVDARKLRDVLHVPDAGADIVLFLTVLVLLDSAGWRRRVGS